MLGARLPLARQSRIIAFTRALCLQLARLGMSTRCEDVRISGVDRKWPEHGQNGAFDPTETWGLTNRGGLFAIFQSPPVREVLNYKHCARRVLGGVKCADASSSRLSAM
jgi:hypothetical protein